MKGFYLGSANNILFIEWQYNNRGLMTQGDGRYAPPSTYNYDAVGRLSSLSHNFNDNSDDVSYGYGYNPASQISNRSTSNDAYVWNDAVDVSRDYVVNGLNQYESAGSASFSYDANGNLTSDGTTDYLYDVENRLVQAKDTASGATKVTLYYDPLGRLYLSRGATELTKVRYLYDGDALIAEYDHRRDMIRDYAHGGGVDDPIWTYERSSGANIAHQIHKNHQGSVVAVSSFGGTAVTINSYDGAAGVGEQSEGQQLGYRRRPTQAGSNTQGKSGYPRSACIITKPASTHPHSAASTKPIPSATKTNITSTPMSVMIRLI